MCGIFGVVNIEDRKGIDALKLRESIELLKHRGPDFRDTQIIDDTIGLAHARLSIIDLSENANQPFECLDHIIVYNGEVFNYVELKEELVREGYSFKTDSDTEVIVAAYDFWKEDCVKKFNGMWAFALYDKKRDVLFCSRDRFGIKPFYYSTFKGDFLFSSEMKSILHYYPELRVPNYRAISAFCRESVGGENIETWFEDIYRLPPGYNLVISNNSIDISKYWDFPTNTINDIDFGSAAEQYKELFEDAIRIRLRSDVPLGATMSSGLDSTSIVATVDKKFGQTINSYTASFPSEEYDEYKLVSELSDHFNFASNRVLVEYDNFLHDLNELVYHLESGHASPAIFPLSKINKEAAKKLTVILEGQGADELMAGYLDSVFIDYLLDNLLKFRFKKVSDEIKAFKQNWSLKTALLLYGRNHMPGPIRHLYRKLDGTENIYKGHIKSYNSSFSKLGAIESDRSTDRLHTILKRQHRYGLVSLLHYGDAISMMHSLESRLPFMDYRLVEFVFSMPSGILINEGYGKFVHRKIAEGTLPRSVTHEKNKIGFKSPIAKAIKEDIEIEKILLGQSLENRDLFENEKLAKLLDETKNGKKDHSRLLFRILCVELWFRHFID